MQTRTTLAGVAVVAALLVTAGIAGALATGDSPAQEQVQTQESKAMSDTITVSASGEVEAQADRAIVRVAVVATGDDIESVREELSTNASSLREGLAAEGINESQIRTSRYDISTNRRYRSPEGDEPEYQAIHAFSIDVNDTGNVGAVIDTAVTNGADEVDGVTFTLSSEKREDLRQEALRGAMDGARSEASAIAGQADLVIAGVDRVSTTEYDRTPYRVEATDGGDAASSTSIDSGPVTVSASVTVVYDIQSN